MIGAGNGGVGVAGWVGGAVGFSARVAVAVITGVLVTNGVSVDGGGLRVDVGSGVLVEKTKAGSVGVAPRKIGESCVDTSTGPITPTIVTAPMIDRDPTNTIIAQ